MGEITWLKPEGTKEKTDSDSDFDFSDPVPAYSVKVTGYLLFMKEQIPKFMADSVTATQRLPKMAEMWASLNDAEKMKWNEKAETLAKARVKM